jgi:hypothetical protein
MSGAQKFPEVSSILQSKSENLKDITSKDIEWLKQIANNSGADYKSAPAERSKGCHSCESRNPVHPT